MISLFGFKKSVSSNSKENNETDSFDVSEFDKYTREYTKLVRAQEFSKEDIDQIHRLQKDMLNMLLS